MTNQTKETLMHESITILRILVVISLVPTGHAFGLQGQNMVLRKENALFSKTKFDTSLFASKEFCFEHHAPLPLPESEYTPILTSDESIKDTALALRGQYDALFQDPREPSEKRFAWDPWFVLVGDGKKASEGSDDDGVIVNEDVPGEADAAKNQIQYSLKRIPASSLFANSNDDSDSDRNDADLYDRLIDDLTELASSIGLTAMTPPWVSLYTNGDQQNFHTDAPHGPMAFVLNLSDGGFEGGETMLLNHNILNYWRGFDGSNGLECGSIVRFIPPDPLGRCIVFDPRIPHGVNKVVCNHNDPRKGRIVVHGWFNEPQVCWFGPWSTDNGGDKAETGQSSDDDVGFDDDDDEVEFANPQMLLDTTLENIVQTLGTEEVGRVMGYLAVRVEVDDDGDIEDIVSVCDTLQADWEDYRGIIGYDEADRPVMEDAVSDVKLTIMEALKTNLLFPPLYGDNGGAKRSIVVPFLFE